MTGANRSKNTIRAVILAGLVLAASSCATLPGGYAPEPTVIAVRNRSGVDISSVTLRQAGGSPYQASRFGSVSPVPNGVTQSVGRATDPPRLSRTVTLEWVDGQGRTLSRNVSMRQTLRSATGAPGETLVFEIGPFEDVQVFVEPALNASPTSTEMTR